MNSFLVTEVLYQLIVDVFDVFINTAVLREFMHVGTDPW